MDKRTRQKLEAAGWVVGDTDQFLGLTDAEAEFVHLKLCLAKELKDGDWPGGSASPHWPRWSGQANPGSPK